MKKIITFLLRMSPGIVAVSVVFGIISGASNIGVLALIGMILTKDERLSPDNAILFFAVLCILMPLSRFISEVVLNYVSQGAIFNLRMKLSRRILAAPLRHLEHIGAPRLYAALTEDVFNITNALLSLPILFINAAVTLGCLIYIGWLSFNVLSIVLLFMFFGVITYQVLLMKSIRYQRRAREETDVLFKHFRAMSDGTKELKLHRRRREDFITKLLQVTSESLRSLHLKAATILTAAASWGQILFFILIGFVLLALPNYDDIGAYAMTGCVLTILYMMTPLSFILNMMPSMTKASISLRKAEMLGLSLDAHKEIDETGMEKDEEGPVWKRLELAGVTHTYHTEQEDESFTLGPIDLSFEPGELVFITGGNGSGKTTLVKLITALYTPEEGEILLDGEPVTDVNRDAYRSNFSVVFSDFHLFESLLGLDMPELDARARHYLKQLHLENKVRFNNGSLSTINLSQGQRKRLALLTAYLENRSIYVFDEWAADQDPLFKNIFYNDLLPALKARGKTVIVITHDDRFYDVADRVIKLDYGKLTGAHEGSQTQSLTLA